MMAVVAVLSECPDNCWGFQGRARRVCSESRMINTCPFLGIWPPLCNCYCCDQTNEQGESMVSNFLELGIISLIKT